MYDSDKLFPVIKIWPSDMYVKNDTDAWISGLALFDKKQ